MASIITFGLKQADGTYKNYTASITDETNQYGQNVAVWEEQSKEEREAKAKRNYVANGKVVWTDGTIVKAERQEQQAQPKEDLPF